MIGLGSDFGAAFFVSRDGQNRAVCCLRGIAWTFGGFRAGPGIGVRHIFFSLGSVFFLARFSLPRLRLDVLRFATHEGLALRRAPSVHAVPGVGDGARHGGRAGSSNKHIKPVPVLALLHRHIQRLRSRVQGAFAAPARVLREQLSTQSRWALTNVPPGRARRLLRRD